jgi:agmatinase
MPAWKAAVMRMKKFGPPFLGSKFATSPKGYDAVIFGAPHGTAYKNIDNRPHAATAAALRKAIAGDAEFLESWDFDFDAPLLGGHDFRVADLGDLPTKPKDSTGNRALIADCTRAILAAGAVPIMIGGDDSVPIPFIEGFADHGPLTILQIDAHIDWRDERFGERLGFSSTMRRASEMAHVRAITQVGMRGIGSAREGEVRYARDWGAKLITARAIHERGIGLALDHISRGANCLITLDCDAIDSATMPAVAYPTPGGLTYTQVTGLIHGVAAKAKIVGFDLIEFIPKRDRNGLAAFTAARIMWNVIGALANARA